jgi:hypothetical protein
METMKITRRLFLARSATTAAGMAMVLTGCGGKQASSQCFNPEQLGESQLSLRSSLKYTDISATARHCNGCSYFTADSPSAGCGTCSLFNGPVNANGHCSSWSANA